MACISEDRVDLLEEKMRAKIDTMTGFSDVEGKSRALEKVMPKRLNAKHGWLHLENGLFHFVARKSSSVAHRTVPRMNREFQRISVVVDMATSMALPNGNGSRYLSLNMTNRGRALVHTYLSTIASNTTTCIYAKQ